MFLKGKINIMFIVSIYIHFYFGILIMIIGGSIISNNEYLYVYYGCCGDLMRQVLNIYKNALVCLRSLAHFYVLVIVSPFIPPFRSRNSMQLILKMQDMSKKSCSSSYSVYTMKNGQDFLALQYLFYLISNVFLH